ICAGERFLSGNQGAASPAAAADVEVAVPVGPKSGCMVSMASAAMASMSSTLSGRISCRKGTKLPGRSGAPADDPFGGRRPTSHERMTGLPWDASYHDGPAPWDTGQPQPAIVRVASEGGFAGAVLDAGCGTGENALHVASLGLPVLGVDVA